MPNLLTTIIVVALLLPLSSGNVHRAVADEPTAERQQIGPEELALLVKRLGDSDFALRERATQQLLQQGPAAEAAVRAGRKFPDVEVQLRCERILGAIQRSEFEQRLEAFLRDSGPGDQFNLPAWDRCQKLLGTSTSAKKFFVEMLRAEQELLTTLHKTPQGVGALLGARAQTLMQESNQGKMPSNTLFGVVLVVASQTDFKSVSIGTALQIAIQRNPGLADAKERPILHNLVGAWIKKCDEPHAALQIAMLLGRTEGLIAAEKLLVTPNTNSHYQYIALMAIAKLGNAAHLKLVEPSLKNPTICLNLNLNNRPFQTQIRDAALAATLYLRGQNPQEFGMPQAPNKPPDNVSFGTIGFETDELRKVAFEKARKFLPEEKPAE